MFNITIERTVKLDDIGKLYVQLEQHIKLDIVVDLLLPNEIDSDYIGIIPSLYQFAFTWVRYKKSGKLLLDISDPDKVNYDELYENELIFPLVCLVWNNNEVYDKTGKTNLRRYLKSYNTFYFNRMKAVTAQKSWKLLLTNFDHLSYDYGILPCFEINGIFIANETSLANNLESGINQLLSYSINAQNSYGKIKIHLMSIIYELMKNTFEWGSKDEYNVPLDPNVRGLLIKFYKKRRETLINEFKNHKGLKKYFSSVGLLENSVNEIYFLEIDVFDSGIGFVKKYKSLNPDVGLSDIDILKKCLIKHNTLARGLDKDDKGLGLDRILNILDGKGFLKIVTGTNIVYRDLISSPYLNIDHQSIRNMELFDWRTDSNKVYSYYPCAEGSVVTIIYPLSSDINNE